MTVSGLGTRLQTLRYKLHYSQKTVASRINTAQSMISAYESGEKVPSLNTLKALARLYHCSTDYLLGLEKSDDATLTINLERLNDKQTAILYALLETWGYDTQPNKNEQKE